MRAGSPYVSLLHSAATYFAAGGAAQEMNGKQIGFLGDRTDVTNPIPVQIQTKKAWEWFKGDASTSTVDFASHYANAATKSGLWVATGAPTAEKHVPRMLLLPASLVLYMTQSQRTAGDLRAHILQLTNDVTVMAPDDASLLLDWCLVAGQANGDGDSLLTLEPSAAYSPNPVFLRWTKRRLTITMGESAVVPAGNQQPPIAPVPCGDAALQAMIAQTIATTMAMVNPPRPMAPPPPTKKKAPGGATYNRFKMAVLMGYSGVTKPQHLP